MYSISAMTPLAAVPSGGLVHVIGVCGVAMAQIALLLSERGYQVSGSDKEFYPPMSQLLEKASIRTHTGYRAEHITSAIQLVIIGNSVVKDNPEVQKALELKLPYSIFPQILYETVITGRRSVVIAGTHGKTTTTALGAFVLEKLGEAPSYFIGGVARNLEHSLNTGRGRVSIVEGDEYDSCFFAKVPKFSLYHPDIFVVTSIEFDHADIYSSLESIQAEFTKQVMRMRPDGLVVACIDDPVAAILIEQWKQQALCRVTTFGASNQADYRLVASTASGRCQSVEVNLRGKSLNFTLGIPGEYNAKNALAVLIAAEALGLDVDRAALILPQFQGVKRRQDIRFDGQATLIEDFAHHPTAVRETIRAVRSSYPGRRLIAIFEPRSNTSRRKVFQTQYEQAFSAADEAILCEVQARASDKCEELLNVSDLAQAIERTGVKCRALPSPDAILDALSGELQAGDVVLLMSNGAFGGLPQKLEDYLRQRY